MTASALKAAVGGKTTQVAAKKPTTIAGFLESYKGEIARALPKHMTADRMARIAMTEFRKNPKLMACDPATLFGAVIQCAQLGLEPGGSLGHAYLLPFENRKQGTTDVQFIIGYRGMIDLARRSGQIISLEARAVYAADKFSVTLGLDPTLVHEPAWETADRGPLKFVYAVAKLKDGGVQFEVMSRMEIEAVRAMSKAGKYGPWVDHFDEMAKKTVIRRLFKYLPVSIEMQRAVGLDEQGEAGVSQENGFVIDGVVIPQQDPDQAPQGSETGAMTMSYAEVEEAIRKAADDDSLAAAADLIGAVASPEQRTELGEIYKKRQAELSA